MLKKPWFQLNCDDWQKLSQMQKTLFESRVLQTLDFQTFKEALNDIFMVKNIGQNVLGTFNIWNQFALFSSLNSTLNTLLQYNSQSDADNSSSYEIL